MATIFEFKWFNIDTSLNWIWMILSIYIWYYFDSLSKQLALFKHNFFVTSFTLWNHQTFNKFLNVTSHRNCSLLPSDSDPTQLVWDILHKLYQHDWQLNDSIVNHDGKVCIGYQLMNSKNIYEHYLFTTQ